MYKLKAEINQYCTIKTIKHNRTFYIIDDRGLRFALFETVKELFDYIRKHGTGPLVTGFIFDHEIELLDYIKEY